VKAVRYLFTTLQWVESEAYGRVSEGLRAKGHEVAHVTFSRRAAAALRRRGLDAICLPERIADQPRELDVPAEVARIESTYPIPSIRDVYLTDPACRGGAEDACVERTVRHFLALEGVFEEVRPDVLVPEVGSETMRTVAHLIARERGVRVLYLFLTIFPNPLRLYVDSYHAPIVPESELRPLSGDEGREVEEFRDAYIARGKPTLPYRKSVITPAKLIEFARHLGVRLAVERDNEYLVPRKYVAGYFQQRGRAAMTRALYSKLDPERPFVYFPLHVTDDFKVKRVIPHCVDQEYIVQQLADTLPQGYDLVLKEHPVSIGRNPVRMLRRLARRANVRLVNPYTSSHELIRRSAAVAVISSTVGLEALLYDKPVLTLGQPFYSGYGVTLDVDSFREIREAVPALLSFQPDTERIARFLHAAMRSTYVGKPAGVDPSDANVAALADSIDAATRAV